VVRAGTIWQTKGLKMMKPPPEETTASPPSTHPVTSPGATDVPCHSPPKPAPPREIGGRDGPEPTRYGDWEKAGRCIDF
jgi:hypothetical protein